MAVNRQPRILKTTNRARAVFPLRLLIMAALVFVAAGCEDKTNDLRELGEVQQDVMGDALDAVPAYRPSDFPARHDINRYLQETEDRSSEWYTYALNKDGEPIFYVVSDGKPRNICVSISSPDRLYHGAVVSAPALDGVYYGGANCDAYYFWDATTGNFIEIAGQTFTLISTKVPLALETDPKRLTWSSTAG